MEVVALVASVVAVVISLGSLILAERADRRAYRAEHRDERRLEREEVEAVERRRGKPIVMPRGGSGGPTAEKVHHHYLLRNGGSATITELWLWIVDGDGNVVSTRAGGQGAMAPGDTPEPMALEVSQPLPDDRS